MGFEDIDIEVTFTVYVLEALNVRSFYSALLFSDRHFNYTKTAKTEQHSPLASIVDCIFAIDC